jgi:hypothetical protein
MGARLKQSRPRAHTHRHTPRTHAHTHTPVPVPVPVHRVESFICPESVHIRCNRVDWRSVDFAACMNYSFPLLSIGCVGEPGVRLMDAGR